MIRLLVHTRGRPRGRDGIPCIDYAAISCGSHISRRFSGLFDVFTFEPLVTEAVAVVQLG